MDLRPTVERMEEELGCELSFGYIGNVYHAPPQDDRLWMVWFDSFPRGLGELHARNKPSLVLGRTEELPSPAHLRELIQRKHDRLIELERRACDA